MTTTFEMTGRTQTDRRGPSAGHAAYRLNNYHQAKRLTGASEQETSLPSRFFHFSFYLPGSFASVFTFPVLSFYLPSSFTSVFTSQVLSLQFLPSRFFRFSFCLPGSFASVFTFPVLLLQFFKFSPYFLTALVFS